MMLLQRISDIKSSLTPMKEPLISHTHFNSIMIANYQHGDTSSIYHSRYKLTGPVTLFTDCCSKVTKITEKKTLE